MSHSKFTYKYKYLQEELKDVKKQEKKYIKQFNEYFEINEKTPKETPKVDTPEDLLPKPPTDNPGKGLYKELSKKLHPDKGGNTDEFSSIAIAYKKGDTMELFLKAEEEGIEVEKYLDDSLISSFEDSCNLIEKEIELTKNTLSWLWCNAKSELEKKTQLIYLKKEFNLVPKSP